VLQHVHCYLALQRLAHERKSRKPALRGATCVRCRECRGILIIARDKEVWIVPEIATAVEPVAMAVLAQATSCALELEVLVDHKDAQLGRQVHEATKQYWNELPLGAVVDSLKLSSGPLAEFVFCGGCNGWVGIVAFVWCMVFCGHIEVVEGADKLCMLRMVGRLVRRLRRHEWGDYAAVLWTMSV
jgi:hypothetical protein